MITFLNTFNLCFTEKKYTVLKGGAFTTLPYYYCIEQPYWIVKLELIPRNGMPHKFLVILKTLAGSGVFNKG